jgi:hypothetical protein
MMLNKAIIAIAEIEKRRSMSRKARGQAAAP